jgi:hypothetical protein
MLIDRTKLLASAVGRPRTALVLGSSPASSIAEQRGARLVREEGTDKADLAFVTQARSADLASVLGRVVSRLEDGGHVVVEHAAGVAPDMVVSAIHDAGLEPLWRDGQLPGFAPTLSVARLPPERRKLSLTVGMISMNEAGAVGGCIDDIRARRPDAEILLVDSSKDETPQIAESKGARVLRQFPPRGYGPAMTRLLYSATTDVIVTMDCDGTYPADRIDELHRRIEHGADLVNASRTHARPKAMPLANYVANRAFATAAGLTHHFPTTDVHSGMRAYRTSMLRGTYVEEKGAALPVEILIVPVRHGYRVEEVDIDYFERIGATTLHRWDSTKWTFKRILRAAWMGGTPID